jgi:hypothetical protein
MTIEELLETLDTGYPYYGVPERVRELVKERDAAIALLRYFDRVIPKTLPPNKDWEPDEEYGENLHRLAKLLDGQG